MSAHSLIHHATDTSTAYHTAEQGELSLTLAPAATAHAAQPTVCAACGCTAALDRQGAVADFSKGTPLGARQQEAISGPANKTPP